MKLRLMLLMLLATACYATSSTPLPTGTLIVPMTDAPFPIDTVKSVNIWIVRVDAKVNAASDQEIGDVTTPTGLDPTVGWVTIAPYNANVDIVPLYHSGSPGVSVTLGSTVVPVYAYKSFRLVLDTDKSNVVLKDGTVLTGTSTPGIKWGSAGKTGVRIILGQPYQVHANTVQTLTIDFNLDKSLVLQGANIGGGLLFKPTIVTKP